MSENKKVGKINKITIGRLQTAILITLVLAVFICIYFGVEKDPVTISQASSVANVTQEIIPVSPLTESTAMSVTKTQYTAAVSDKYNLIYPAVTENTDQGSAATEKDMQVFGPIITFQGESLYPNSVVMLEFNSDTYYVTRQSDSYGRWSWTNYGQPFDKGDHVLTVYNIVPVESLAASNVYVQKYGFKVSGDADDIDQPSNFNVNTQSEIAINNQDEINGIFSAASKTGLYLYGIQQIDPKVTYQKGEDFTLEFTILPVISGQASQADIKNTIYSLENSGAEANQLAYYTEKAPLSGSSYRKIFTIADYVTGGTYLLQSEAMIGDKVFVQDSLFDVEPNHFITIAGSVIDRDNAQRVLVWNIIFFLLIIITIMIIALMEFRRIFVYHPLDEKDLEHLGIINKTPKN